MALAATAHAAFPGANGKIVFESQRGCPAWAGCGATNLYTINPDGSSEAKLLPEVARDAAWSPDGRKIAFTAVDGALRSFYIAVVNADGTGRTSLDPPKLPSTHDAQPSWSPDGKRIAFTRFVPSAGFFGLFEIFVMNVDGINATRLTFDDPYAGSFGSTEPAWSPDGRKIAFSRTVSSPNVITDEEVFVMNADGSGVVQLTHHDTSFVQPTESFPTWSPDGGRIAFSSFREGGYDVYTMRPDATDEKKVSGPGNDLYPAWSPDGSKIAVANQRSEYPGYEILVYDADGSGETKVTNSGNSFHPDWQPVDQLPDCSVVSATPGSLWTPNRTLVTVTLAGASDPDGDPVTLSVEGVTQDEPVESSGDATSPDPVDEGDSQVRVRAERNPHGDGRVYRIAFTAEDGRGGSCSGVATVSVARNKPNPAVDSAPPSYDSLTR
jgi:Tol biopolymer transport system component